jgi:hypothetical protein
MYGHPAFPAKAIICQVGLKFEFFCSAVSVLVLARVVRSERTTKLYKVLTIVKMMPSSVTAMSEPEIDRIMAMVGMQDEVSAFGLYATTYLINYIL